MGRAPANNSLSDECEALSGRYDGGQGAMDNLSDWVATIAAVAVGLMPGLALSARSIARLIYHMLGPRSEVADRSRREPAHGEPTGLAARRG
jgi:hypothetical protein